MYNVLEPAFKNDNNCIVLSADDNYMPITAVALKSIVDTANKNEKYDIIVINDGISDFHKNNIERLFNDRINFSIRFYDVSGLIKDLRLYTQNRKSLSQAAYYRCFIPWILSNEYKKALYIDGDMILTTDIKKLFDIDIGDNYIAAVKDYWGICNYYMPNDTIKEYRQSIGITDVNGYVISGTVLFNLENIVADYTLEYIQNLISSKEWYQHDQDVLNVAFNERIFYLNPTWGFMSDWGNNHYLPSDLLDELGTVGEVPNIIHYGGGRKPYINPYKEFDSYFWKTAKLTPYFTYFFEQISNWEYAAHVAQNILGEEVITCFENNDLIRLFDKKYIGSFSQDLLFIDKLELSNNKLSIEGKTYVYGVKPDAFINIVATLNGIEHQPESIKIESNIKGRITVGQIYYFRFLIDLEFDKINTVGFYICIDGLQLKKKRIRFNRFTPLANKYANSYFKKDNWCVRSKNGEIILDDISKCKLLEYKYLLELVKIHGKIEIKAVLVRLLANILKSFKRKPIWLISDRVRNGDDNGEAFFKYVTRNKKSDVDAYFVINRNSEDYERLKSFGKVVSLLSIKHKLLYLISDVVIVSQTDEEFKNPLLGSEEAYRDLTALISHVFLQHGVIATELSAWLKKDRQNFSGFVTTTEREYNSIVTGNYMYDKEQVWLTGLTRFDYLEDADEKIITIIPTWRKYLAVHQNHETGSWKLKNGFENSEYATFYNQLLTNERLLKYAGDKGYKIQFKIHPSFLGYEDIWKFDDSVSIVYPDTSYREIYKKSSLLVTDYSSAINDFIYLRKPIIYAQFDYDKFFSGEHNGVKEGYLNYAEDGFGEVEYTLESTVDRIIEYIENDCKLKDKYRERIDKFFVYNDKNNCQRVYEKIKELDNR